MRYNKLHKDNNFLTPTTYTQTLSEYAANLCYEDLPDEVVERAKLILLQTIGVSLAAKNTELAQKIRRIALEANNGPGGNTTAWITGERLSTANAALLAGTLADLLDWEDCSWTGHPSAGIVPVGWITAEERHGSGKDLLTAIVAAYEVYQRIAMAVQPDDEALREKGWGLTSWQIFGCVIAAAKIYRLDARQINQTIGLAAEISTIPASYHCTTMSDFYHYEHGYRAQNGVLAAKAVEKGIYNQLDALDEPLCYTAAICDTPKPEWFSKDLGQRYLILETLLKHWPANMWVQTAVEIVHDLAAEHDIGPNDVEEIILDPGNGDRMWAPEQGFDSLTHAQFSTPFVIAAMLHQPVPGAHWYTPENLKSPSVIALARRVKAGPSPLEYPGDGFALFRQGKYPTKHITLKTKDGAVYQKSMDGHPGHPANMMSREEIADRFRLQASPVLQGKHLEQALDSLLHIEQYDDISELKDLLCTMPGIQV